MLKEPVSGVLARRLLGILLIIAAPGLAIGTWHAANGPLQTLAWFQAHRTPADSFAYASALYHAGHAQATHANRWQPTGYATLGLVGVLVGAGLVLSTWKRRTA